MALSDGIFGKISQATKGLQATGQQLDWFLQGFVGTEEDVIKTENSIGAEVAADFFQSFTELKDPAYVSYISQMHQWLIEKGAYPLEARFANRERKWHTHVISDEVILGACLPGGYIIMSRPLVDFTKQDQNEVAFILAHETAHILLSHARKRAQKEFMVRMGTRVVPVAGAAGMLLKGVAGGLARNLVESAYAQDSEFEADRLAVQMMRRAGFDPKGAVRHFERVNQVCATESSLPAYYAQHPAPSARIANIENAVRE